MPGAIAGAIQGFEAADAAHARAAMLGIEQQRVSMERQRQDTELGRQKAFDSLSVAESERNDLANQARPHLAYLGAAKPPPDVEADPDGYKAWQASDDGKTYQQHADAATDLETKADDILQRRDAARAAITGAVINTAKAAADKNAAGLMSGSIRPADMSPGDTVDMLSQKSKMPPHFFQPDPKTGRMPIQDVEDAIQNGIQTGNWQDKGNAISALIPETQAMVGKPLGGGTISGVTVSGVQPDRKGNVLIQKAVQVHMPDGTNRVVQTPNDALIIPMDTLGKRAAGLQKLADFAAHPEVQAKVVESFKNRDSSWHKLNDQLLAAGVPQNELLPAPYGHVAVKPGEQLYKTSPTTGEIVGGPEASAAPRAPAKMQEIGARMAATGEDFATAEQNVDAGNKGYSEFRNPNIRPQSADGGAGAAALADARIQKQADLAHRGAVLQLAREKGYVMDKDGNARYGSNDPNGAYKKGDAVTDTDFDQQTSDMKQASDEAAQSGKPLPTSKLVSLAKDKIKAARSTPAPLPKAKTDLKSGQVYQTARGPATWDGDKFVAAAPAKK